MLAAAGVASLVGIRVSGLYAEQTGVADPSEVVIDEVAGQWIACAAAPLSLGGYVAALIAFRLFDILKPGPIGLADRKTKGGLGIMLDDILSGIAAAAVVAALAWAGALASLQSRLLRRLSQLEHVLGLRQRSDR